jgi:hypothetical protein
MTIDFAGLLDAPAYETFGVAATLTAVDHAPLALTVLFDMREVDEAGAGGIIVPTIRPTCVLRLADLAAAGLAREDLVKAAIVIDGTRYRVESTAPTSNARELRLILIEDP